MQVDTQQALDAKAMQAFTDLLKHKSVSIRSKAARDIFDLSMPLDGKNEALKLETIPLLVNLLKDEDVSVRCKATLALEA